MGVSELCNCATRSHFALYVCMYVCMYVCTYVSHAWAGPGAYQVTSYAGAARVSRGYMVCACGACRVVTWFARMSHDYNYMVCARARVAWLHGLPSPIALALPYRVWPDPRASTL